MSALVKICGVQDPETAYFAAKMGADFVGMIHVPSSRRHVEVEKIQEITSAVSRGGAQSVVVVVDITQDSLDALLQRVEPDLIQLYSAKLCVPSHVGKLYVNINEIPETADAEKDYILLDHPIGGQGKVLDWNAISAPKGMKWFLAGGLHAENVCEALEKLRPHGVDVSSGVETNGVKDLDKIMKFIHGVKSHA